MVRDAQIHDAALRRSLGISVYRHMIGEQLRQAPFFPLAGRLVELQYPNFIDLERRSLLTVGASPGHPPSVLGDVYDHAFLLYPDRLTILDAASATETAFVDPGLSGYRWTADFGRFVVLDSRVLIDIKERRVAARINSLPETITPDGRRMLVAHNHDGSRARVPFRWETIPQAP